jgi:putative 4-mercaptohistidine N1-methyltranferase
MHSATSPHGSLQISSSTHPNPYESDRALQEYLLFHYGAPQEILPWVGGPCDALEFPVRCVSDCLDVAGLGPASRALDLGCAVGRSSYELARTCGEVVGVDFSHRFIAAAEVIRTEGCLAFESAEEGPRVRSRRAMRPEGVDPRKIRFEQGDAQSLHPELGVFDVVLMANLIDRLPDPELCLRALAGRVSCGGQLILTSPYTWMEQFTPRDKWLCRLETDGFCSSLSGMKEILEPHFRLSGTREIPFLIREHARKYQWSVAEASVWRREG